MFAKVPGSLGPPGPLTQTTYYLGEDCLESREDLNTISNLMAADGMLPESTRLRKHQSTGKNSYEILQASLKEHKYPLKSENGPSTIDVQVVQGDHKAELQKITRYLHRATDYVANYFQHEMLEKVRRSFLAGDLEAYKKAQRAWVNDKAPAVETVIGFVEPYRDPLGVRAEFEGIVGIADRAETSRLQNLANMANRLVCRLPWTEGHGESKGPFEKEMFEPPDFASVQSEFIYSEKST